MMAQETNGKNQKEPGVQSIRRATAILEIVSQSPDGINLAELSKAVGLHNSTTFHLTKTMVAEGILRQNPGTKCYHVGTRLFSLAAGAIDEIELVQIATPILAELAAATGENSHIAVPSSDGVVIIAKCDGSSSVRMMERIGSVRPAYATAIGKAILSSYSKAELEAYLDHHELVPHTAKTITDRDLFIAEIERIKINGIAYDDAEFNDEARCMAVPFTNFTGTTIGSVGISGPAWRINIQDLPRYRAAVFIAANKLSSFLGTRPEKSPSDDKFTALG